MATTQAASGGSKTKSSSSKPAPKSAASKSTASKSAKASTAKSTATKAKTAAKAAPKTTAAKAPPKRDTKGLQSVKRFDGKTSKEPLAFAFLMKQHREVEGWFEQYEKSNSDEQKTELSAKICKALKVHTQIEEELLYPDAHEKLADEDMVDEAYVEHDGAKMLIAQIEAGQVGDHLYDAKVKVLGEYVKHHVKEEEQELFPEIEKLGLDLNAIGERMQARSEQLMNAPEEPAASGGFLNRIRETLGARL